MSFYDKRTLIIREQKDTNDDKKFKPEDDVFYKIILEDDIAKIKVVPLVM